MSIKLFDIKIAPAKLRFECHFHHRWEDKARRWMWPSNQYNFEIGVNRYKGLKVRGTNVRPITFIPFVKVMPLFKLVLTITWRYRQELRLEIDDNGQL